MVTMKDVARAAGVSTATVSTAISGRGYVKKSTRNRVMKVAKELGYSVNSLAQGLRSQRTKTLGLSIPDITNPFYTELVRCVQNEARAAGYSLLLGGTDHEVALELDFVRQMRARYVDGLILAPFGTAEDYTDIQSALGEIPFVLVNNVPQHFEADAVIIDNFAAGFASAKHLLDLGHRRIAVIAGPQHTLTGRDRLRGAEAAFEASGVRLDKVYLRICSYRQSAACESCLDLLDLPQPPTAIFASNNHLTVGAMRAIAMTKRTVPADISVCGVDDFVWSEAFSPRLSTMRQPIPDMAKAAVRLLLDRIDGSDTPHVKMVFDAEFVERESCAPPVSVPVGAR